MIYNYRKLLSERAFLKVHERAKRLKANGTQLFNIEYSRGRLQFKTRSATDPAHITYTQTIDVTECTPEGIRGLKYNSIKDLLMKSGLKIHCNCLGKDTDVLTKDGYKKITEVVQGDQVLGSDGQWHVVACVKESELKSNWKRVKIHGIYDPLLVTTDHKLLWSSYRDYCQCGCGRPLRYSAPEYREARAFEMFHRRAVLPKHNKRPIADGFQRYGLHSLDERKPGELLCSPIVKSEVYFDPHYARILGYYLAEGFVRRGAVTQLTLNRAERPYHEDIKSYFDAKGIWCDIHDLSWHEKVWTNVDVHSKEFQMDCSYYCGNFSHLKCISTDILFWNKEAKANFILGYWLGDGSLSNRVRFNSTSLNLLKMLQMLLNSLGVCSNIRKVFSAVGNRRDSYELSTRINAFYDNVYAIADTSMVFGNKVLTKNLSRGCDNIDEYALYRIESIEDAEPQIGYDVCLFDEPHTYVANNVIVSNCPAFHYWGYKYMAWKRGYGIQKEVRFPYVRNPHERGFLCKHLHFVLSIFPFITPQVASKMGKYMQGKDTGSLGASFGQTRRDKEALIKEYESTGLRHAMTLEEAEKRGELDSRTPYFEKKFGLQKSDSIHEIISDAVDDTIEDEMEEMDYMIDEIDETFDENGFGEDEIRDSISNQSDGEGSLT